MDLEHVKRFAEKEGGDYESTVDSMPPKFIEPLVMHLCKNSGNSLHGGATAALVDIVGSAVIYTMGAPTTGVSVEINVSYLDAAYAGDLEFEYEMKRNAIT
ncbi:unnamed protein product [Fraxinus pennsylvanica]|uniref:Thioesterase domain-containing protein n=1 Tax=Fraxinus pennsylvanica TaxID=56036 RepID=A0AAD2A2W5_9LAMI|nr:unnamed protein product [Fraxinus pennsylvanica]